jgi:septal ring factor EnvC (AmiA/AmiB activator)
MLLRALWLALGLAVAPVGLSAQGAAADPVAEATAAAEALRAAITALQSAEGARDRVAALTQTIGAYERGLGLMRDRLRRVAVREGEVTAAIEARRVRIAQVLGAMTAFDRASGPLALVHPDGPADTVRSAMVMAAVAPALEAEAADLRAQLEDIARLRRLESEVADMLSRGLQAVQAARTALSQAMQDRVDLPRRFLEDPEELKALVGDAETLDAFATGLSQLETDIGAPLADFAGARGNLPLPVLGRLLRAAGEADAAGIRRPGLVVATAPEALVTTPWPATVRDRGPLLDYGNVMVLEPAKGYLLVLAGLGTVYGETGDVLAAGAPVGLMPGRAAGAAGADGVAAEGSGFGGSETLYLELRQDDVAIDPAPWFSETKG